MGFYIIGTKTIIFNCLKATEGGVSQRINMEKLKANGIPCRKCHSPYVGHYGIEVSKRHERKAEKLLYG